MADTSLIIVVKRDFVKEPYSYDKIIFSILKSGVPMANAEGLSKKVETWVLENTKKGEIKSSQLRDKIIEVMSKDFPGEADTYKTYVKG
jgi:transcriptional regulator NrdR family protein